MQPLSNSTTAICGAAICEYYDRIMYFMGPVNDRGASIGGGREGNAATGSEGLTACLAGGRCWLEEELPHRIA